MRDQNRPTGVFRPINGAKQGGTSMYTVLIDKEKANAFAPLLDPGLRGATEEPGAVAIGVADDDDIAAGVLLARMRSEWLDIGWIYVAPEYRGRSMGKLLLSSLATSARRTPGVSGVFAEYPNRPEDDRMDMMFRMNGFRVEDVRKPFYMFTLEEMKKNPFWQKKADSPDVIPLEQAEGHMLKAFVSQLMETEQPVAVTLPIDWREYHQSLSVVFIKDGMIGGVLLFQDAGGILDLAYVHVLPNNGDAMGFMLRKAGQTAIDTYSGATPVSIAAVNAAGEAITEKLFPDLNKMPIRRAVLPFRR
jgi:GNAT superfamily N-acetyltransferase